MAFKKNNIPWNKGKKGVQIGWSKGLKRKDMFGNEYALGHTHSEIAKKKMSACLFGNKRRLGIKHTERTKKLLSKLLVGRKLSNGFLGKKHSESWIFNMTGKNHPCWIDGRSFLPYPKEFNNTIKISIRKRDNYTCKGCGKLEGKELDNLGRVLSIHHIDFGKNNCDASNLITLCSSCNTRANTNRYFEKLHYQDIIKTKIYG